MVSEDVSVAGGLFQLIDATAVIQSSYELSWDLGYNEKTSQSGSGSQCLSYELSWDVCYNEKTSQSRSGSQYLSYGSSHKFANS